MQNIRYNIKRLYNYKHKWTLATSSAQHQQWQQERLDLSVVSQTATSKEDLASFPGRLVDLVLTTQPGNMTKESLHELC